MPAQQQPTLHRFSHAAITLVFAQSTLDTSTSFSVHSSNFPWEPFLPQHAQTGIHTLLFLAEPRREKNVTTDTGVAQATLRETIYRLFSLPLPLSSLRQQVKQGILNYISLRHEVYNELSFTELFVFSSTLCDGPFNCYRRYNGHKCKIIHNNCHDRTRKKLFQVW